MVQVLCRSGCGFYGNPASDGLCSLCFKKKLKKTQQVPSASSALREAATAQPMFSLQPAPVTDASKERSNRTLAQSAEADNVAAMSVAAEVAFSDSDSSSDKEGENSSKKKKKKNRCQHCRKKIGLTGFPCRCGNLFCGVHRYSDKHACSFNYREMGAQEIRLNNPVVAAEKIQKI